MVGYWWLTGGATLVCAYSFIHDIVTIPTLEGSVTLATFIICQLLGAIIISITKRLTIYILRYKRSDPTSVRYIIALDLSDRIFDVLWILIVNLFWFCATHMRIENEEKLSGLYSLLKELAETRHPYLIAALTKFQFLLVLRSLGSQTALWCVKMGLASRLQEDLRDYLSDLNALIHLTCINVTNLSTNAQAYHTQVLTRLDTLKSNSRGGGVGCYSTVLWILLNPIQLVSSEGYCLKLHDRSDCQNFVTERFREIALELECQSSTVTAESINTEISELPVELQRIVSAELRTLSQKTDGQIKISRRSLQKVLPRQVMTYYEDKCFERSNSLTSGSVLKMLASVWESRKVMLAGITAQDRAMPAIRLLITQVSLMLFALCLLGLLDIGLGTLMVSGAAVFSGATVALSFVYTDFIQSTILTVFTNPYDRGDRVRLNGVLHFVKKINVYATEFETLEGKTMYMPHVTLRSTAIVNESRSIMANIGIPIRISASTSPAQLAALEILLQNFLNCHSAVWHVDSLFTLITDFKIKQYIEVRKWAFECSLP